MPDSLQVRIERAEAAVANLEAALDSGAMTVVIDGETTTFASPTHLRIRLRERRDELARLKGVKSNRPVFGSFDLR